jgi:two-component system response regulator NreC
VKNPCRILIAEDHAILREGLRALLCTDPNLEIVGEAGDGQTAIRCVDNLSPDLVLMDLSMPKMSGLEAIRDIKNRNPDTKIIVLTVHKTEEYVLSTLQAGADGYVLKDADHSELRTAIKNVMAARRYLSPEISEKVITGYLDGKERLQVNSVLETLTKREREVLKLIAEGYKNREVAHYLFISPKTVEKHRANLMKKLNLHNASALTAFAIEKGIVDK